MEELKNEHMLELSVHDESYKVLATDVTPATSLVDYLRQKMHLTGTKYMCKEGGCGTCIVNVTMKHPVTRKVETLAVNSCLISIFQCGNQWKVTTNEGLVSSDGKLNDVQDNLMKYNGTQCGFCSSGMVMTMNALKERGNVKMQDVEDVLGGNICRCTGYRPILTAFKAMAQDATEEMVGKLFDIEDFPACAKKEFCQGACENDVCKKGKGSLYYDLGDKGKWYRVETINEIMGIFDKNPNKTYTIVAGNTAKGVYWDLSIAEIYIDIYPVKELKTIEVDTESIEIGANITLTEFIEVCKNASKNDSKNFGYLEKVKQHLELVAHISVRNIGTIAGNLMIKHSFNEFPSDIFLLLETISAQLTIVDANLDEIKVSPQEFLKKNMKNHILKQIKLSPLDSSKYKFETYKIMPRAQNAHAMLNAGFLFKMNQNIVQSACIVFGGINPNFVHAKIAEGYVTGKNLYDNATLQGLFAALDKELKPDNVLPDPSPVFRKKLAISLAYKFILSVAPNVNDRFKTGGQKLIRNLSKGTQEYETDPSLFPISKPIAKLEAKAQVSGEAEYIFDMPDRPGQLFGAFVLARAPAGSKVKVVDTSKTQKGEGFVKFYDVKSLKKGVPNSFVPTPWIEDPLFVDSVVRYWGQPLGLVVATTQNAAESGAWSVIITYEAPASKPLLSVRSVLKAGAKDKLIHLDTIVPKKTGNNVKKEIKGTFDIYSQYHYTMETQNCFVIPKENGVYNIHSATQWPDLVQQICSQILGVEMNKIYVEVRRCGGAYGSKISRANIPACAAVIAAADLKKPIKVWMPFTDNMDAIGTRNPASADYTVKVDEKGVIQSLDLDFYTDTGITINESPHAMAIQILMKGYNSDSFNIDITACMTDCAQRTWTRAPGTTEAHAAIENIMEHIAHEMNIDPVELRLANLSKDNALLIQFMKDFKVWADVDKRKVEIKDYNTKNRWRKRGFSMLPLAYNLIFEQNFTVDIGIFHVDGSVSISHGGVEIGQGINTKAVQTVAHYLKIDVDQINVIPANTFSGLNSYVTGGSQTSEAVCAGLVKACKTLNDRINPVREDMRKKNGKEPTWAEVINECFNRGISLKATDMWTKDDLKDYLIYCVVATEVEYDVLSGNHIITRVDLLEDTGTSMNPYIDIGQVEGAFVMGMGYWTMEEIIRNEDGKLMNNRTWNYKVPGAKDIPVDFRVKFPTKNPNPASPFKSKATAEPPLNLSFSVGLALKDAINSARLEADKNATSWLAIDGAFTVERNFLNSLHDYKQYTL